MTCRAKNGLCQKCYGLAATGQLPNIGQNMGVIASQSVSEVLTQAMLSTKHQGGVAGRQRNPYEEANNILSNPENFQDEASVSEANGSVEKISQTSLKDWEVDIAGRRHFIPNLQTPVVKVGDKVRVGDPISTGTINPRKLTMLKGSGAGRVYLANEMRRVYSKNAQLDPRHFDVIARNMMKFNQVIDPGSSEFLPGDKIEVGQLEDYYHKHKKEVSLAEAEGKVLAASALDLTPGTTLTKNHLDDLAAQGATKVHISTTDLVTKPIVPGLQNLKLLDKNWISKLSFNRLPKTISEAAALGYSSPVHSTEPVASYILGSEFGEGEHGKY
jgi:DNA-directed RNA polymerase subunit beta'